MDASAAAADNPPGTLASLSPTRIRAPSPARPARAATMVSLPASPAAIPSASCARTRASVPGEEMISVPLSLSRPGDDRGAIAKTAVLAARTALRSRRKTIGDSSSGSKPTSSTVFAPAMSP